MTPREALDILERDDPDAELWEEATHAIAWALEVLDEFARRHAVPVEFRVMPGPRSADAAFTSYVHPEPPFGEDVVVDAEEDA